MADGSHLPFDKNVAYTKFISFLANSKDMMVEAELGRLSGTEDDLTVEEYEARLTDIDKVVIPMPMSENLVLCLIFAKFFLRLIVFISGREIH